MIVELAIATQTAPEQWRHEDDATIATAIDVLAKQAARIKKARR
jgi:uncharacterized protein YaeQ